MLAVSPDTTCMVAAICEWHEHHMVARRELHRRLGRATTLLVAAPALIEAYSVLTRLPAPYRLDPRDALSILDANFITPARVVTLDAAAYQRLLRRAPADGIAGGRIYGAVIAECIVKGRDVVFLTFNASDFVPFVTAGLEIVVPGRGRVA